jgi:hypothetical protein
MHHMIAGKRMNGSESKKATRTTKEARNHLRNG